MEAKTCIGDVAMIIFQDVISRLAAAGFSTYKIRKEKLLPESTMQKLRSGGAVTTDTVNTLCRLLQCQPGDLMKYVPEEPEA